MTTLLRPPSTENLAGALGLIDGVVIAPVWGAVDGWLVHPDRPIDSVQVRLNGGPLGESGLDPRPDVAGFFPSLPHAERTRYLAQGPVHELEGKPLYIEVIGLAAGRPVIRTEDYWPGEDTAHIPAPDADLRLRVSGRDDAASFRQSGYGIAAQLLAAVRAHLPGVATPRLLDWGCGSGRATRYMPHLWPGLRLTGCDIDAEAVDWCRANIEAGRFDATPPYPPLPYADAAFDAVVGSSVMTHLAAPVQMQWLREIHRVLAPGGVFVTSVLGTLAGIRLPEPERAVLSRNGIMDQRLDPALDGVAPKDYYRSTYQSEAFTRRQWGKLLPVLDYRAGGLTNYQDLVVMRREPSRGFWRGLVGS